ncbi:MAG: type I-C CRISPR-associated protein Cas7/Csd2 [Clostridiales bacterium]|nr:type I-C CRISPR-associated protein Cas7/Csd2 [Clostridiales bacterium]
MEILKNKIDFTVLVSVKMANPNGDPLDGNRPRTNMDGYGEISDVCIKRKIRNRLMDMGYNIFVQSDDKRADEYKSLSDRASNELPKFGKKDEAQYAKAACEKWIDVRSFGQVFAFKSDNVSVGVRGPVSIHQGVSISEVEVNSMQITKSVNSEPSDKKSSDTMGMKHMVRFGLYKINGSINVQLAEKTGFSEADAEAIKECLRTLFVNDTSSARPDGSMEVIKVYWWKHNCAIGQYSSAKVHRLVEVNKREGVEIPVSVADYDIKLNSLPELLCEEFEGI